MNDDLEKNNDIDDLEAQLSALGIFGDDDDGGAPDPFAGFDFGDDDDDPFATLGGVSEPAPTALSSGDDSGDFDLDKQLEMLLMADQSADESFEVKDISASLPTQSVYDPEVDGMGSVQYVKGSYKKDEERKEKLFANISPGKMLATAVIGAILIIIGAATAILAHSAVLEQQEQVAAVAHFTPIEIPSGVSNNANIIFVNERAVVGEQPFTLLRICAAYSGTFIYFEEHFNPDDYYILLFNQARNLYSRTTFNIEAAHDEGTVLQFGPLSRNTLFLTLHIQCRTSNEFARFNYRLTAPPIHETPVFINQPINVAGGNSDRLVIRHAVFDSVSSTIHFSYMPNHQGAGLRFASQSEGLLVALDEIGHRINPLTKEDSMVYFDRFGLVMGSATFGPILSLESNVDVVFNNLVYFYPSPIVEVTPEQLFGNNQRRPLPVQTGAFTLNLEGMEQQGTNAILTLHGLDENNRRRAVNLDITLRVALENDFIEMPGDVRVSERGSDVIFDMRPYGARLRDVHVSQYSLIIDWVEYEVPSVSVPINVSRFYNLPRIRRYDAELAVTQAFTGLLSYKSGELSRDGLVGLSPELRNSDVLLNGIFAPAEFEGRAMYAASVSTGDLISNYDYLAIVEVLWTAGEGPNLQYYRETFQITARSSDAIWSVTEIIRI